MKVLVTGHRGYIGAVLTPMLHERGHDVTGLDSDIFRSCTFSGALVETPTREEDVRDVVVDDLAGFDAVIHLAGLSNDPLGDYRPNLTQQINCEASVNLAQLAKKAGVPRFLFASSCSNYGAAGSDFLSESAAFNPVTPYGVSKVDVEHAVAPMADESFSPTFLRASTAYGLSPRIRFDLVLNNLTAWAFTTGQIYLKSDGSPWRPIVHVEDIARAYIAALEADRELVHNEAFNVGLTTENYQVREIADIVQAIVPNSRIEFAPGAGPDTRCYRVDCNFIGRRLHAFKPQWTARRGVEQLYEAFCSIGLSLEDFEGERFKRIAHVNKLIRDGDLDEDLRRVCVPAMAVAV
ncbi:NAD-dependent epimerase/dehydratase family protein [Sinorhizobium meliloti]|uniref:NAD-dependent epimerase/dehydratase family protein n=1 Tax=Rhizobium meliloti TaxID=382 RepID=UPI001294D6CC|nr:SDR family oxidoreductase [Sinorhizobium meliloti]MDW9487261.1 NAD-dependent epimerase/dehydratase family protein [Sinorhizobium meliloti]MDW9605932.1 NAD-dependent epimerase/dehydratase family protein [Sinorhizobium meliloti]MDW9676900.1 NAD-dependent epimerase/dehydratase family protein [Sinorhizobium meliloti]MDW9955761.1 NAD-dependent epimerase/dehydratase family protein [Sinorhizobium meliloti]MDX0371245.1 NAD-dependent epimerase/dehydratase family protein [Sinorhizobium meliloti]